MSSSWTTLHLHVEEPRESGAYVHIADGRISGQLRTLLPLVDPVKKKSPAAALDVIPPDASAETKAHALEIKRIVGVSVMTAQSLAQVAWEKGPKRTGFVDGRQYARILDDQRVESWSKGVFNMDILDNDVMAAHIQAGTTTFRMVTRATWTAKLRHEAQFVYELYSAHMIGRDDRRMLAIWGRS